MTVVDTFVPALTIFTVTPGSAALVLSETTPLILPRSDCAKERIGTEKITAARTVTTEGLLVIFGKPPRWDILLPLSRAERRIFSAMIQLRFPPAFIHRSGAIALAAHNWHLEAGS